MDVAHFDLSAHGKSTAGANQGPVYTHHEGTISMKSTKPGTSQTLSYCDIHGLWESAREVDLA